jgi:plastocyanin
VRSIRASGLLVASMMLVAACGGAASPAASSAAQPRRRWCLPARLRVRARWHHPAATVTIRDFSYSPAKVAIKAGQAVAWTNEDTASHTATTTDGACTTKTISKGSTVTLVFLEPGTYEYHCAIHATMPTATVEVTE